MTVNITGTCPEDELKDLKKIVNSYKAFGDWDSFNCLSNTGGICGIGDWAKENINAIGNLSERDYDVDSVAAQLKVIGEKCPNAYIKINCGGDYESPDCVATLILDKGKVEVLVPEVETIEELNPLQMQSNFLKAILR